MSGKIRFPVWTPGIVLALFVSSCSSSPYGARRDSSSPPPPQTFDVRHHDTFVYTSTAVLARGTIEAGFLNLNAAAHTPRKDVLRDPAARRLWTKDISKQLSQIDAEASAVEQIKNVPPECREMHQTLLAMAGQARHFSAQCRPDPTLLLSDNASGSPLLQQSAERIKALSQRFTEQQQAVANPGQSDNL